MIDPISIGVAFAAAQTAVNSIKSAINTGKDIYSITKDIGKFLHLNADINKANVDLKVKLLNKTDAELEAQAFEAAMMAHQINEQRKQLKDLLYWSGNAHIWDNMVKEHTRLLKEKREMEKKQREIERKKKEELADIILNGTILFILLMVLVLGSYIGIRIYLKI